jgi:HEPN domain-containing protein
MPLIRRVRPEALDWLEEAKADLRHAMQAYGAGSHNWACFVAEQAAEKAIKAFLIGVLRKRPIHSHDLTALHRQTRGRLKMPASTTNGLAELSAYYTGARYPNSGLNRPSLSITAMQARRAMRTARGVLAVVKREIARRG